MGTGFHGGSGVTKGSKTNFPLNLQFFAARVFEKGGHISKESFEGIESFCLGSRSLD